MVYTLLDTPQALSSFYPKLQNAPILAIDTEFTRKTTYYSKLSLLQICYQPNEAIIIDCLAPQINLKQVLEIIYNPNIVKVFHSSRQDLEILYQLTGSVPTNLFDTQIAVLALNYAEKISYEKMVQKLLKVTLDKSLTQSDWQARPLTPTQVEYAAYDCLYLYAAYTKIVQLLNQQQRNHWLDEEFKNLENLQTYLFNPHKIALKIVSGKDDYSYNIALEIVNWREEQAKILNLPRNNILKEDAIKTYLKNKCQNFSILEKYIHSNVTELAIKNLKSILDYNISQPISAKNTKSNLNVNQQDLLQILQIALRLSSIKYMVNPYLIASKEDLINYCLTQNAPFSKGWKYDVFGCIAEKITQGQLGVAYKNNKMVLANI